MKRPVTAITLAALAVIVTPGLADAAPVGTTVTYQYTSDTVRNDISYTGRDGKTVTRVARFAPLPIGFSREQYGYSVQVRLSKGAPARAKIMSGMQYATCKISLNGRQVAYRRELFSGIARC